MPSCAEFGVINQYLSIKDQIDSGFYCDQPEVPDIFDKQKHYDDSFLWSGGADEGLRPANFLEMDRSPWYLEPVDKATLLADLSDVPITTTASDNSLTTATNTPTVSMQQSSAGPPPVSQSMTAGAGCTVTQRRPGDSYESDNSSSGHNDDGGPDIYDLDTQSYGDDTTSSSSLSSAKAVVKVERPDGYSPHHYGYPSSAPQARPAQHGCRQVESMESIMVRSITSELRTTSKVLGIPKNPYLWRPEDTMKWVRYTCEKNLFSADCVPVFNVEGKVLCQMTLRDFQWRVDEETAAFLHQSVDIAKMSIQLLPETPVEEQSPPFFPSTVDEKPHISQTFSPAPSTGSSSSSSTCDEDSYITSTGSYSASQGASHNAPNPVSASHRGARAGKQTIHLWQFLRELLDDPDNYQSCIKWLDRSRGVFKIEDSSRVAKYWGRRKNRPAMNYDKLSRSVRQYYKKGIIKKTEMSKRLVYQFCTPYL